MKSENYIGGFKISRIYYFEDKAMVILVQKPDAKKKSDGGRAVLFYKKENDKWKLYREMGIPFKYNNEEIVL
jgi:ketosteroid isomerase-like protein